MLQYDRDRPTDTYIYITLSTESSSHFSSYYCSIISTNSITSIKALYTAPPPPKQKNRVRNYSFQRDVLIKSNQPSSFRIPSYWTRKNIKQDTKKINTSFQNFWTFFSKLYFHSSSTLLFFCFTTANSNSKLYHPEIIILTHIYSHTHSLHSSTHAQIGTYFWKIS